MTHATMRPEFENLIDPYAPVGQLGTGFTFTEGPIWHPVDHYLLFSDMPADVRRRWDAKRGVVEVKRPSNKCNGMTYDTNLNLIVCEHATSSLIRERPDGSREVIASHFDKQELNSPNDVCVHSSGAIYFSDPWYGRMPVFGVERPRQLGFQGVYRVPPGGGAPQLLVDRYLFDQPNGLCFSPDEKRLYVNDTVQALIRVFDVEADGSISNARIFANGIRSELEPGQPDGMKCDQQGNIWVTAPGGVWVYAANGDLLGKVRVPELVANLTWGGADFRTLYMTSTHSVYTVATKVGPRAEPYMTAKAGGATASSAPAPLIKADGLQLDPNRCALILQDLQNDVIMEGGAFADSGAPAHARSQARRGGACPRHPGDPRLVRRRTRRAGYDAERAIVRRPGRRQGAGARLVGCCTGGGAGASSGRPHRRKDADERVGRQPAGNHPEGSRPRRADRYRRLDQHVDRAHRAHRRRQGLFHDRARGLLFDNERRVAQRLDQFRASERFCRHQRRRRDQGNRVSTGRQRRER
jgi:sugar lactone lactonase YvrE